MQPRFARAASGRAVLVSYRHQPMEVAEKQSRPLAREFPLAIGGS
jgi:hypothetical protein